MPPLGYAKHFTQAHMQRARWHENGKLKRGEVKL